MDYVTEHLLPLCNFDMTEKFNWMRSQNLAACGITEGDQQLLHFHINFGNQKALLTTLVKGWFLREGASEKTKLGETKWKELMRLASKSQWLAPDIRAILMHDHDTPRKRFYLIVLDIFIQQCGKNLRQTQNAAIEEHLDFLDELSAPHPRFKNNRYKTFSMPLRLPGMSHLQSPLFVLISFQI